MLLAPQALAQTTVGVYDGQQGHFRLCRWGWSGRVWAAQGKGMSCLEGRMAEGWVVVLLGAGEEAGRGVGLGQGG